jgi:PAS domain S-box-containing protein
VIQGRETSAMTVIVVIDDQVTNRRILSRLAASLEADALVKSFGNPMKALEWVKANTPDLVVTDFKMPEMDGAAFNRAFRGEPLCYDVPVMVVTVFEDRDFRYQALEAGATDFLLSPIDHREFRVRARNLLTLRAQQKLIKNRAGELEQRLRSSGRRHEQELRRSREQLLSVLDAVPAMIGATDADSRYIFINQSMAAFLGINPDEAIGKTQVDLFGDEVGNARRNATRRIVETGESPPPVEVVVTDRSGGKRTLLSTKRPFNDESGKQYNVVAVDLDITDRKLAENALAEQRHFLRAVIDNIPSWIFTTSSEGCITLANNAFADACGTSVGDIEGQLYSAIDACRDEFEQIKADDRALIDGDTEMTLAERRFETAANDQRWIQFTKVRFPGTNGDKKILTIGADFTERKTAENTLRSAKEQAEAASRSKTEFLANMSHELRTPLNAIIGFAEMIEKGLLGPIENPKYLEYAHNINESGQHLLSIINDILEVSKIEAGQIEVMDQTVDIRQMIQDVVRIVRARADEQNLDIEVRVEKQLPSLRADERKVKQILLNLLSNAIKFTPAGGTVRIDASAISDGSLQIGVEDTGVGIAEEDVPRALERFGQVEHVMTRLHSGTGLGLPLAAGLAELHDGSLSLESKEGEGTTVTVVFPPERSIEADAAGHSRKAG